MERFTNFTDAIRQAAGVLVLDGQVLETKKWQGIKPPAPMLEAINHSFTCNIPDNIPELTMQVKPNLPWAEAHFRERVGGEPLNPGKEYLNWPFYPRNVAKHQDERKIFTHTYMERFWCRNGGTGLRYRYGDLNDLVAHLKEDPHSRQAYLPIWFPEDTGVVHGGRVPCTLGYHFIMRSHQLHIVYYIRSCDFIRHFRDDIYMAARLVQWVLAKLRGHDELWSEVVPGTLTMHITSLHCWAQEKAIIMREYNTGDTVPREASSGL